MKQWLKSKKWMMNLWLIVGLALAFVQAAFAGDVDMLHVLRPKSDVRIKIETINNAKEYVNFITYHHDNTESSHALMEALRLAALRGVHVRYIYDAVASNSGSSDFSKDYLAKLQEAGVEIRGVTIADRLKRWGPFKLIHSKSLVADAGDGYEVSIAGGRNVGDRYMEWLDNTFVLRYKAETRFGSDIRSYFDKLWNNVSAVNFKSKGNLPEKTYPSAEALDAAVVKSFGSPASEQDLESYRHFMRRSGAIQSPHFELSFSEIHFVSSNLIDQISNQPRVDTLDAAFNEILTQSKKLEISTIFFYLSKAKRQLLQNFLKSHGELTVTTNQMDSFKNVFGGKKNVFVDTLDKMQRTELADLSKMSDAKLKTYVFADDQFTYHHTKYIIGDNAVLLTSSNSNYSSDTQGEENGLYIKSKTFTDYMKKYSEQLRNRFFVEEDYQKGVRLNPIEASCSFVLKRVF